MGWRVRLDAWDDDDAAEAEAEAEWSRQYAAKCQREREEAVAARRAQIEEAQRKREEEEALSAAERAANVRLTRARAQLLETEALAILPPVHRVAPAPRRVAEEEERHRYDPSDPECIARASYSSPARFHGSRQDSTIPEIDRARARAPRLSAEQQQIHHLLGVK